MTKKLEEILNLPNVKEHLPMLIEKNKQEQIRIKLKKFKKMLTREQQKLSRPLMPSLIKLKKHFLK